MLPDGNGMDVLRKLRTMEKKESVIIISAKDSIDDKVLGLEFGADDYLAKPFHLAELKARIKSVMRRNQQEGEMVIQIGNVKILSQSRRAYVSDVSLELLKKEYDILHYFMTRPNHLIDKTVLAESVWG